MSSCSFTLPSREESAELGRRGFFRSGSPAWASSSGRPVTYAGGAIVTETKMEVGGEASKLAYQEPKELFEPEVQTTELQSERPEDMLSQIEFDCEGTERSVNKAITTVRHLNELSNIEVCCGLVQTVESYGICLRTLLLRLVSLIRRLRP